MEPLVKLSREKWPILRDEFKKNWPFGVPGYYLLDTQISHPDIEPACNFRVFCPYGDISNGLVAFNTKGDLHELIIRPTSGETERIVDALATTKLIDWGKPMCIPHADTTVLRMFPKLFPRLNLKLLREIPTIMHFLHKDSPLYELKCPQHTYTGPLKLENIPQIDKVWSRRYATSYKLFELLINNGLTYGLFSTEDNALLAWVTIRESGYFSHFYCEESHRNKGYAEYMAKFAANDFLQKGKDLFGYIVEDNYKSMELFRKLGCEVIGRGVSTYAVKDSANSKL